MLRNEASIFELFNRIIERISTPSLKAMAYKSATQAKSDGYSTAGLKKYLLKILLLKSFAHHKFFAARSVSIKTFAAFYTEFSRHYHVHQQRTGSIFCIAIAII